MLLQAHEGTRPAPDAVGRRLPLSQAWLGAAAYTWALSAPERQRRPSSCTNPPLSGAQRRCGAQFLAPAQPTEFPSPAVGAHLGGGIFPAHLWKAAFMWVPAWGGGEGNLGRWAARCRCSRHGSSAAARGASLCMLRSPLALLGESRHDTGGPRGQRDGLVKPGWGKPPFPKCHPQSQRSASALHLQHRPRSACGWRAQGLPALLALGGGACAGSSWPSGPSRALCSSTPQAWDSAFPLTHTSWGCSSHSLPPAPLSKNCRSPAPSRHCCPWRCLSCWPCPPHPPGGAPAESSASKCQQDQQGSRRGGKLRLGHPLSSGRFSCTGCQE